MSNGNRARREADSIDCQPFNPKVREEQAPEQLTELEATKLQLFALRHQVLQQQVQSNLVERAKLIASIEEAHPGHRWDDNTGLLVERPHPLVS